MEVLSPFTGFFKEKRRSTSFTERPAKRARLETILQNLIIDSEKNNGKYNFVNRKRKFVEPVINVVKRAHFDKRLLAAVKIQKVCRRWLAKRRYIGRAAIKIQKVFRGWSIRSSFHIFKYAFYTC